MSAPLVIAGGGLAGSLAALALAELRPDVPLLLVEQGECFGGNHVWSFFDSDVADEDRWMVDPLVVRRWPEHDVRFPSCSRTLAIGYNSIRSSELDRLVRARLRPDQLRLGRRIAHLGEEEVVLEGGERISALGVIDARGPDGVRGLDLGWQKFVGRTYAFDRPHGIERPVIMDACVAQDGGYRFVYLLPFGADELMVEDTYYDASPALDVPLVRGRTDAYVRTLGLDPERVTAEESGVLPVVMGGEAAALWGAGAPVPRLGLAGGYFHPTTGYSLPDAVRNARILAAQDDFRSPPLHALFRRRSEALWGKRRFFRLLNRMLFRAGPPERRYRILEHFYRLPEPVVARFYAARLTAMDKLRILSGRPPVPIRGAIAALRRSAA